MPEEWDDTALSLIDALLFLWRMTRPDIAAPVVRLSRMSTKWITTEGKYLTRLCSYLNDTIGDGVHARLRRDDDDKLEIPEWNDAELCGDSSTTRSTSGWWIELAIPGTNR